MEHGPVGLPGARRARTAAPDDPEVLDDVDLDAGPDGPGPHGFALHGAPAPPPAAAGAAAPRAELGTAPRRRTGGPLPALLLAAAVAAATWGVGVRHVSAGAHAALSAERAVISLQAGHPQITSTSGRRGRTTERGEVTVRMAATVPLVNRGPEAVDVELLSLSPDHQVVEPPPDDLRVEAGRTAVVRLHLQVDCASAAEAAAVRAAPRARTRRPTTPAHPESAEVAVEVQGQRRVTSLPFPQTEFGTLTEQMAWFCTPTGLSSGARTRARLLEDGRAQFTVRNAGASTLTVDVEGSTALGISSEPALPLMVPSDQEAVVRVALEPHCAEVGTGFTRAVHLVAVPVPLPGRNVPGPAEVLSDPHFTGSWVARQVALTCG